MKPLSIVLGLLLSISLAHGQSLIDRLRVGSRPGGVEREMRYPIDGMPILGDRTELDRKRILELEKRLKKLEENVPRPETQAAPVPARPHDAGQAAADLYLEVYLLFQRGEKALATDNQVAATESFQKAYQLLLTLEEDFPSWQTAIVKYRRGRIEKALEGRKEERPAEAVRSAAFCEGAIAYFRMGNLDEAINALTKSLVLDIKNAKAHFYLGQAAAARGWSELAARELRVARQLDPGIEREIETGVPTTVPSVSEQ